MLPDPNRLPTRRLQRRIGLGIAANIARQLRRPIRPVGSRHVRMLGATVPEASVDEDSDAGARERDVNADRSPLGHLHWVVASEAEPRAMKRRPQRNLGPGVTF